MFPKIFHISTNYNEDYFSTLIDMYLVYRIERICTRFIIQVLIQMGIGILNELKLQFSFSFIKYNLYIFVYNISYILVIYF